MRNLNPHEDASENKRIANMSQQEFDALQQAPLAGAPAVDEDEADDLNPVAAEIDQDVLQADLDDPLPDTGVAGEREGALSGDGGFVEVLESDLDESFVDGGDAAPDIHASDLDAPNLPGEVDIEDLDEDAVRDLLPPDARLDPIEE